MQFSSLQALKPSAFFGQQSDVVGDPAIGAAPGGA